MLVIASCLGKGLNAVKAKFDARLVRDTNPALSTPEYYSFPTAEA